MQRLVFLGVINDILRGAFVGTDKSWHINRKELWTVVHAVSQFGKYWVGSGEPTRVLILCDNKTAVACINKRTSSKSHMQVLCERLAYLQLLYNCEVRAAWIPCRGSRTRTWKYKREGS